MCGYLVKKERRQSRDMETSTEQEYLMSPVKSSTDSKAAAIDNDNPFFGMR